LFSKKDIQAIFDREYINGEKFWSRADGNIYSPIGSSTLDTLFVLSDLGLSISDYPVIAKAVDLVFSYQTPDINRF
jgi:hypothetical protein